MSITRRQFVTSLSIAGITAVSGVGTALSQSRSIRDGLFAVPASAYTDFYLTRSHFDAHINSTFLIGGRQMRLVSVTELISKANQIDGYYGESFSLLFSGRRGLEAGSYKIAHASFGEFDFLVQPVGLTGREYEVVINRIQR